MTKRENESWIRDLIIAAKLPNIDTRGHLSQNENEIDLNIEYGKFEQYVLGSQNSQKDENTEATTKKRKAAQAYVNVRNKMRKNGL